MTRVRFTALLGQRIGGGISFVDVPAATVAGALRALTDQYPAVTRLVWAEENVLNPMMAVFLNDHLLTENELNAAVNPGDQIDIVQAVSGGGIS